MFFLNLNNLLQASGIFCLVLGLCLWNTEAHPFCIGYARVLPGIYITNFVLSCAILKTIVRYLGNSVPKMSMTKGLTNQFSFVYTIVKSLYLLLSCPYMSPVSPILYTSMSGHSVDINITDNCHFALAYLLGITRLTLTWSPAQEPSIYTYISCGNVLSTGLVFSIKISKSSYTNQYIICDSVAQR